MKKLLFFRFFVTVLLVNSAILHAAAEHEAEMEPWVLNLNLSQACSGENLPRVKRLLDAGATDIEGQRPNVYWPIRNYLQQSVEMVELLIRKGCSIAPMGDFDPLECALTSTMPFEYKKAKVTALLEAGVWLDFEKLDQAVADVQEVEKRQRRNPHSLYYILTPGQWDQLGKLIMDKASSGREFAQSARPLLLEKLPVDGPADLVGQYTHPYWDGRNQTREAEAPEVARGLEDGGENQEPESVQELEGEILEN